ncbi:MAG: Rpn family recombination-promoting nuclease/putative transposase [Candidatus Sericytochromatia bacterium]
MKARYLNPFTDFGFKKLFGEEASKHLLMDFLNALLPLEHPITELSFRNAEQLGEGVDERKAIYDIYCQDSQGSYFIVEMQKAKQNFFKDRTLFYTTFPIRDQAEPSVVGEFTSRTNEDSTAKGPWNFELKAVYCIGILDFVFEEDKANPDWLHEVKLKNRHNKVFYDKYALYFIEMPKFHLAESELANQLENWVYLIKHLEEFPDVPARFQHTVLEQVFEIAELSHLTEAERAAYETSLKHYRDMINVVDTARLEGEAKGLAEGLEKGRAEGLTEGELKAKREMARQLKQDGLPSQSISKYTGLSMEEIEQL